LNIQVFVFVFAEVFKNYSSFETSASTEGIASSQETRILCKNLKY